MLGLIKKDLLMIKGNTRYILPFVLVFCLIAIQGNSFLYFIPAFISTTIFMSTFSYDDYNKWDAYAITLPNGRKNVVKSKYIANLLLIVLSIVVTYLLAMVVGMINNNFDMAKTNSITLGCFIVVAILQAVMYPLIFKFGVEKSRISLFVGVFVISALLGFLFKDITLNIPNNIVTFFTNYYIVIAPSIALLILYISYIVSKRIYMKKEF